MVNLLNKSVILQPTTFKCVWITCSFFQNNLRRRRLDEHALMPKYTCVVYYLLGQSMIVIKLRICFYFYQLKNNIEVISNIRNYKCGNELREKDGAIVSKINNPTAPYHNFWCTSLRTLFAISLLFYLLFSAHEFYHDF